MGTECEHINVILFRYLAPKVKKYMENPESKSI
jgi:hypothetical protein